ncbi:DNA primase [Desulfopila inferna]|uniref:DNA primase n=1 Tax=Desulfopila inferna TaxID=468528 RepID=UPI001965F97F|nr:DNA primase [Desulfopila inferna]MBM9605067.1 DNA primase [Desulfopila inferna]
MGFIETRQDITASVKEQADIVKIIGEYVELKRSGIRYLGCCPFHNEKTPSFSVHGPQQFYHCFGCHESGDVFSFLMKYHNYDFPTALKYLADKFNIALPRKKVTRKEKEREEKLQRMYDVTEKAARIYRQQLHDEKEDGAARLYLREREIPEDIQSLFQIGYAPAKEAAGWNFLETRLSSAEAEIAEQVGLLARGEKGGRYDRFRDRILFPIFDAKGRIIGFGGRIVGQGQPKYMNSPESPIYNKSRNLLGLYQQREEIRRSRKAIIVEGNFDLISLVTHGCTNVVAPLGTALTASQIRLLSRYSEEMILLFDGDEAGVKAAVRAAPYFLAEKVHARVALLPPGHDPDTFVRQKGLDALQALLAGAGDLSEFLVEHLIQQHGLTLEGKSRIAEEIKPLVTAAHSPLQRSVIIAHFADRLGVDPQRLEESVSSEENGAQRMKEVARPQQEREEIRLQPLSPAQKRLAEFMVMNPRYFKELEEKNLRETLRGGVGEILFLQIKMMTAANSEVQPEEIFSALPEGPERNIVADMLFNASRSDFIGSAADQAEEELQELLEWLDGQNQRNLSRSLTLQIEQAQKENDFVALEKLLLQKQTIEREMRGYGE